MKNEPIPRPEYPRPDFVRHDWLNLNGWWDFDFGDGNPLQPPDTLKQKILVPFVHQCPLSGIGETAQIDFLWYRRTFEAPDAWKGKRILLHFGAVDYQADVYVNSHHVGTHKGGYTPFTFDITSFLKPGENTLDVRAFDPITPEHPSGKQTPTISEGCVYTRSSGIWQTVWLEAVSDVYLHSAYVVASLKSATITVSARITGEASGYRLNVVADHPSSGTVSGECDIIDDRATLTLKVASPQSWDIGNPQLYALTFCLTQNGVVVDRVHSYTGFRDVTIDGQVILLNEKPLVFRGILDQGYWPAGLYTAPTDEEMKLDIVRAQQMGFDSARLHQKVFDPRMLYWADVLGYPVWAEFADWGCDISLPHAQENYQREWTEAVLRDRSHPSVVIWTPFNERAGSFETDLDQQDFVTDTIALTRTLDSTRPICGCSGFQHVSTTDIADIHDYDDNADTFRARLSDQPFGPLGPRCSHTEPTFAPGHSYSGQPVVASEVGGILWAETIESKQDWGYGEDVETKKQFLNRFKSTLDAIIQTPGISGYVYTQLTDVEQEKNGLYTYDRQAKFDPAKIYELVADH